LIAEVARMGIEGAQCEVRTIAVALAYFESHRKQFPTGPEKTGFVAVGDAAWQAKSVVGSAALLSYPLRGRWALPSLAPCATETSGGLVVDDEFPDKSITTGVADGVAPVGAGMDCAQEWVPSPDGRGGEARTGDGEWLQPHPPCFEGVTAGVDDGGSV